MEDELKRMTDELEWAVRGIPDKELRKRVVWEIIERFWQIRNEESLREILKRRYD